MEQIAIAHKRAPANVTPAVIEEVYKVSGVTVDRSSKNKQAVAEFQGQTYNSTDLDTFFEKFVPSASNSSLSGQLFPVAPIP